MKQYFFICPGGILALSFSIFISIALNAQVGIGTTDPKTALDVNGALSLSEGTPLTLSNGNNNNISLGISPYSLYRITGPGTSFNITGIVPTTNANGQIVVLQNTTTQIMTLIHNNNSTAANRIYIPGEKDLTVRGRYASITLQYNAALNRWVLLDKLNHLETWYLFPLTINPGLNVYTATLPGATSGSSFSVNFTGPINPAIAANLLIEYTESQTGALLFRIRNTSLSTIINGQVAITVNKI